MRSFGAREALLRITPGKDHYSLTALVNNFTRPERSSSTHSPRDDD
jgi:hypothetical protein